MRYGRRAPAALPLAVRRMCEAADHLTARGTPLCPMACVQQRSTLPHLLNTRIHSPLRRAAPIAADTKGNREDPMFRHKIGNDQQSQFA